MTKSMANILVLAILAMVIWGGTASAQITENVILVTYDGLRWQELFGGVDERLLEPKAKAAKDPEAIRERYWADTAEERRAKLLPFFWGTIAKNGQVYGNPAKNSHGKVLNGRYFSYPGYNEILTGFADDRVKSNAKIQNPNVTVLEWLNMKPDFSGRVAAFASWDVFPYIINSERSGVPVSAGWMALTESTDPESMAALNVMMDELPHYWDNVRYDVFTFHGALGYMKKHKPRLIYVGFDETDDWAHGKRYGLYLDAAQRTDDYIRRLWEAAQSMPEYAGKTSLVITSDHGRGDTAKDWTGHGTGTEGSDQIWVAVLGPDTPADGVMVDVDVTQSQVAATVAALLGEDYRADVPKAGKAIKGAISN